MLKISTGEVPGESEISELEDYFSDKSPQELISWADKRFGSKLAIITSFQAEGTVLIDMAVKINPEINIITIDTGRLHPESYDFMEFIGKHYGIKIQVIFPRHEDIEEMISRNGINLFYNNVSSRLHCCSVRKVVPLLRVLEGFDSWITGLRKNQGASRKYVKKIESDVDHGGIVKLNPLADWDKEAVNEYSQINNVPQHPLYAKGYASIGCQPCTRPVKEGEDSRAGRWWWETDSPKECGMHCRI